MWKWMSTPEAKKIATSAQEKVWKALQQQFPRADGSKFEIQANFSQNHTATAEVFSKAVQVCQRVYSARTEDIGAHKWRQH